MRFPRCPWLAGVLTFCAASGIPGGLAADRSLGIAGGMVRNILPDGSPARGGFKNPDAVGGPIQMFRRTCYEDIGGYRPYGHEDGQACANARRRGWTFRSFPDIWADHHVPYKGYASTIASMVPTGFYLGQMHYGFRMPLWFEGLMALRECAHKPFVLAGASMFAGHIWAMLLRKRRGPKEVPFWRNQREYVGLIREWETLSFCTVYLPRIRHPLSHPFARDQPHH